MPKPPEKVTRLEDRRAKDYTITPLGDGPGFALQLTPHGLKKFVPLIRFMKYRQVWSFTRGMKAPLWELVHGGRDVHVDAKGNLTDFYSFSKGTLINLIGYRQRREVRTLKEVGLLRWRMKLEREACEELIALHAEAPFLSPRDKDYGAISIGREGEGYFAGFSVLKVIECHLLAIMLRGSV